MQSHSSVIWISFKERLRKIQALQMVALGLKRNGIQPLDKNCIPDLALAGSNTNMRIHSTLTGFDAIL
jgi:hypothetical protein